MHLATSAPVKEHQKFEISGALHYIYGVHHIAVPAGNTPDIIIKLKKIHGQAKVAYAKKSVQHYLLGHLS